MAFVGGESPHERSPRQMSFLQEGGSWGWSIFALPRDRATEGATTTRSTPTSAHDPERKMNRYAAVRQCHVTKRLATAHTIEDIIILFTADADLRTDRLGTTVLWGVWPWRPLDR